MLKCVVNTCAAAVLLAVSSLAALSDPATWSLDQLNKTIDQTNFVVNDGCSGTLISLSERLVLTNYHCVDSKISSTEREVVNSAGFVRKVQVRRFEDVNVVQFSYNGFTRTGSASYLTEIVAADKKRDLAALRFKSVTPHIYASQILRDGETVVRGERVYIVGNPARNDATVVEGIVSNVNRTFEFPWTGDEKLPMIQFSGGIYGGSSGGALYNSRGQLIGVPAAGLQSATFIGLAIPSDVIKAFLRDNCLARAFDDNADDKACLAAKEKKEKQNSGSSGNGEK